MLTTTGADGQLCVWDLALERDPEEEMNLGEASNAESPEDLPPQLLFVHGGQNDLKEVICSPCLAFTGLALPMECFHLFSNACIDIWKGRTKFMVLLDTGFFHILPR